MHTCSAIIEHEFEFHEFKSFQMAAKYFYISHLSFHTITSESNVVTTWNKVRTLKQIL